MRFLGSLGGNDIGGEGAKAIGEALAANQSLTSLEYAASLPALAFYSPLLSAAADTPCFLADVLAFVCLFGRLNSNKIGAEGAKAIGGALAVNQSLTSLKYATPLQAFAFTVSSR